MAIFVSMVQIEVAFNNKKAVWWAQNLRKGLGEFSRQYYPHSGGTKKKKNPYCTTETAFLRTQSHHT